MASNGQTSFPTVETDRIHQGTRRYTKSQNVETRSVAKSIVNRIDAPGSFLWLLYTAVNRGECRPKDPPETAQVPLQAKQTRRGCVVRGPRQDGRSVGSLLDPL